MNRFSKTLVIAAVLASVDAQAALVVVDDFSTAQALVTDAVVDLDGIWSSSASGLVGILGGQRDIFVFKSSGPAGGTSSAGVAAGSYGFANTAGTTGLSIIRWDGSTIVPIATTLVGAIVSIETTGLGGIDLIAGMNTGFSVVVTGASAGAIATLQVYTDAGNWSELTVSIPVPGTYVIPFPVFAAVAGAGADFSNIGALQAILMGDVSVSAAAEIGADLSGQSNFNALNEPFALSISLIAAGAIPEPNGVALVLLALLAIKATSSSRSGRPS